MRKLLVLLLVSSTTNVFGADVLVDFDSQAIGDTSRMYFYDTATSAIATTYVEAEAFNVSTWLYIQRPDTFGLFQTPSGHPNDGIRITSGITSARSACSGDRVAFDCTGLFTVQVIGDSGTRIAPFTNFGIDIAADDSTDAIHIAVLYDYVVAPGIPVSRTAVASVSLDGLPLTNTTVSIADLEFVERGTVVPVEITTNTLIYGVQVQSSDDPSGLLFDNITYVLPTIADTDTDGDGVPDSEDNCPDVANSSQLDLDGDDIGDVCDDDADGDGEFPPLDCDDLDPSIFTGAPEICSDGIDNDCDALIDDNDPEADCDGDLIPNDVDNCPNDFNPGQADIDADGIGDVCDDDDDNDGFLDDDDNCPAIANDQADFDLDGVGDACDSDNDGDGVENSDDLCAVSGSSDGDAGVPSRRLGQNRWADVDGDGLFDTSGKNPTGRYYTMDDTAGCNCAQIIEACGYGQGHINYGCSNSVMDWWTGSFDREGEPAYQCED